MNEVRASGLLRGSAYISGVVLQLEGGVGNGPLLGVGGPTLIVRVLAIGGVELLQESLLVCLAGPDALLVELLEHAGVLIDELADDGVVEVLDGCPLDALLLILLLLSLERQLNEHLLELLIAVVDAKLLEAVRLEKKSNSR